MKILLAVDGSTYSDAAIEEVLRRPWPPQSEVKAITAFETPIMVGIEPWAATPTYFDQLENAVREAAKAIIDGALEKLKTIEDTTLKISSETIQGPPRQVIVEESERWGADLIIMAHADLALGIDCCWAQYPAPWFITRGVPSKSCGVGLMRTATSNPPFFAPDL
jgi:nucleotide-binding universal stress UspA family protein